MCVGEPFQVLSVDGIAAVATDGTRETLIDLSLTGPIAPGTWILTFLGAAREVISEAEARQISEALAALRTVMTGGQVGDAFADLEATGPRLPSHLQAALAEGRDIA